MQNRRQNSGAVVVLLLFVLLLAIYLGSYLALVQPLGTYRTVQQSGSALVYLDHYRVGGLWGEWIFWPLEQIDRKLRPGSWGELY